MEVHDFTFYDEIINLIEKPKKKTAVRNGKTVSKSKMPSEIWQKYHWRSDIQE